MCVCVCVCSNGKFLAINEKRVDDHRVTHACDDETERGSFANKSVTWICSTKYLAHVK